MSNASTTSPFVHCDTEEPWVVWTDQSSLMELMDKKQTECRSSFEKQQEDLMADKTSPLIPQPYPINRPQYNAILNRMNIAKQKTGTFTSWNT